jgi:hypothetical protein
VSRNSRKTLCRLSGKRRFRDHLEAMKAIRRADCTRKAAAEDGVPCRRRERRCYECEQCKGWHLTSWVDALTPPRPMQAEPAATPADHASSAIGVRWLG